MTSDAGWARHRLVGVWVMGASSLVRMPVDWVERAREERQLHVVLQTYSWSDESLYRAVMRAGRIANNSAFLEVCVKLSKLPSSAIPEYEAVSRIQLFTNVPAVTEGEYWMRCMELHPYRVSKRASRTPG
ncbi:unnamed protein product [Heligmosomoides polygyrus]|uniref:DUF5753 domain-containing protein n=1 Tax=Heligmosomoides polygyrus TaxID=6339 RepID=A0A183GTS9_HELPZ|nr:unnamed protein product [Heligmosomoides polygyrus]